MKRVVLPLSNLGAQGWMIAHPGAATTPTEGGP